MTSVARTAVITGVAIGALGAAEVTAQAPAKEGARRASAFTLLGAWSSWTAEGNRVRCGINNQGDVCSHIGGPYGGGGFWPVPTYNQYIFNSGLQIAGIVPAGAPIWAGDTVGAYFFDARGTQPHGQSVTLVYSTLNPDDPPQWPAGAVIHDGDVYHPTLLGRDAISAEDTWVRYYDGPRWLSYREHGMGILVEQRTLQWNYPVGNEDILYLVFRLTNITASDPGAYAGQDPAVQGEIAGIARGWVEQTEEWLGVDLPARGVPFDSVYVALAMDADVEYAGLNGASAILPFHTSLAYKNDFDNSSYGWFQYPPEIAAPPFGPHPGFVGAAFVRTPPDPVTGRPRELTLFATNSHAASSAFFPDPVGVSQLWRYLSGRITPSEGDPPCQINPPIPRRLCALMQAPSDTRFYQSTGPFSLAPGQSETIVVAYVFAGAIDSVIAPYVGGNLIPGIPPSERDLASGTDTLRVLERAAGWLSHADADGSGAIEPDEVQTVPRSFLHKVQLARALADRGFLLPTAPDAPEFFTVPGDDRVTVVWRPSATESAGDPYYQAASDPTSGLYDPNYRQYDVEGYRVYRGTSPDAMALLAQFDYDGTTLVDYTGAWDYGEDCAPELGVTAGCPTFPVSHALVRAIPQVRPGNRIVLDNGLVVILARDNAVEDAGFPPLANTGVPFMLVDSTVQNGFPYFYAVTAFDVNAIQSGPTTLESPIMARAVTPRRDATNLTAPVLTGGLYGRGRRLASDIEFTMDAATGTFSGPPPPTDMVGIAFDVVAPTLLDTGTTVTLRVDSIVPSYYFGEYYLTLDVDGQPSPIHYGVGPVSSRDPVEGARSHEPLTALIPADPALAEAQSQPALPFAGQAYFTFEIGGITFYSGDTEWHKDVDGVFWDRDGLTGIGGSRWFDGANEATPMPGTRFWRGALPGITTIFTPQPNWSGGPWGNVYALFRRLRQSTWHVARQADVRFYWGLVPGTLDSVIDVTHNVPVPFLDSGSVYGVGWGFRNDIAGTSTTYTAPDGVVTAYDFAFGPCFAYDLPSHSEGNCVSRPFQRTATLGPVDVTGDYVADGQGFALYFNHEFYLFRTNQLPANTVWTHRSYFGLVDGAPGSYGYEDQPANPAVPGLALRLTVDSASVQRTETVDDLAGVHTVPDPFYYASAYQTAPSERVIRFVNLPDRAIVRIYSLSGVLVAVLEQNDPALGGEVWWDARNRGGRLVASGVYFYHVETPSGAEKIGRMTIVSGTGR